MTQAHRLNSLPILTLTFTSFNMRKWLAVALVSFLAVPAEGGFYFGVGNAAASKSANVIEKAATAAAVKAPGLESHTATLLQNGTVLIAGGINYNVGSNALSTAMIYNPSNGTLTMTGSMSTSRAGHVATLLANGKVLVAGGTNPNGTLASAELYDPTAGTWSITGTMLTIGFNTATLLPSGKVLVTGASTSAELYDPATATWSATGSVTKTHFRATATLLNNGKVLVAGTGPSYADISAELYDPTAGTWSTTGSMAIPCYYHAATLLSNGKVLVSGGICNNGSSEVYNQAQVYDPTTATWSLTGSLSNGRISHTATLLSSGKVLAAGGYGNLNPASAELYNPTAGTWSATGSMASGRSLHTATFLSNGTVLMVGGRASNLSVQEATPIAEIFNPTTGLFVPQTSTESR